MRDLSKARITYSALGDLLYLRKDGVPCDGGGRPVTMHPDLTGFYRKERQKCVGFDLLDAALILLPILERNDTSELLKYPELLVEYRRESDTLTIGNREEVTRSEEMAAGITAHIGDAGLVNRFTLENASATLLPHFRHPIDQEDAVGAGTGADGLAEYPVQ